MEQYRCLIYPCDSAYETHLKSAVPEKQPVMSQIATMTWDDIWMHPVEFLVQREVQLYEEEFPMIVQDLFALPAGAQILAEGTALLPELVSPALLDPKQALWIVPTERFQREHYARRPWIEEILGQCADPVQAFENWMARDSAYARLVKRQARERGLEVIEVDGTAALQDNVEQAARWFGWSA